jgi:hypothetical protein
MGVLKGTTTLIGEIPFTELYERLLNLGRIDSPNNSDYAKGLINDSYTRTLPRLQDWNTMIKEDTLVMVPTYDTGTVSVNAGSTSLTGVGTTFTSSMTAAAGYKITIQGNPDIYTFEYVSATTATISPGLSGANNITGNTFKVFKDEYDLAADFDRLLKNGSVYVYMDGRLRDSIKEVPRDFFREDFLNAAQDPIRRVMRAGTNSVTGRRILQVNPYPKTARVYPYEYYFKIVPMSEYDTGTISVTNASTAVVGTDTAWASNVAAGDYLRVDANGVAESSIWYKIATVTDDNNIVLESNFGEFTESSMEYTICKTPVSFPSEFHEFILYDALVIVGGEQGDPNAAGFAARREEILESLKMNYKSRRTNTQFRVGDDGIRSGRYDRDDDINYRR